MRPEKRAAKAADEAVAAAMTSAEDSSRSWNPFGTGRSYPSKTRRRKRALAFHRVLRLAVQVLFFVLAPGVFTSAMNGVHAIFSDLGATQPVELASFVVILAAALGYTVLFGRFFCGYACAFGTMGDVLYYIGTPLRKLVRLEGKPIRGKLAAALRWVKFVLLVAICTMCFTGFWNTVSSHSPWTVFGRAVAGEFSGLDAVGLGLLIAIMVFQMLFERSFCRFLCPMGAVFSLMPVLPFSQYGRNAERCGKKWCNRCIDNCPAGIYPDKGSVAAGECFECGRCADVCPLGNANLLVRMEKAVAEGNAPITVTGTPAAGKSTGQAAQEGAKPKKKLRPKVLWSFKGTGVGYVLVRAAVLLVVLWLVGATRFLPNVATVLPNLPWLS